MKVGSLTQNLLMRQTIARTLQEMREAQWQQASGKKSATFGGIAPQSSMLLSLRNRVQGIQQYQTSITATLTRTTVMQDAMDNVAGNAGTLSELGLTSVDINPQKLARVPAEALSSLEESVAMLNAQVGDRFLFAGDKPTTAPLATGDEIMNGKDGAKGLSTLVAERIAADAGPAGNGYVSASAAVVVDPTIANTLTIAKDTGFAGFGTGGYLNFKEFGFDLVSASYNGAGATDATSYYNATLPSADADYQADLAAGTAAKEALTLDIVPDGIVKGDTIELKVTTPTGEELTISLTLTDSEIEARDNPDMLYIDPDPLDRLDDIAVAVNDKIAALVQDELARASVDKAADWMFDYAVDPSLNDAKPVPRHVTYPAPPAPQYPQVTYDTAATPAVTRWYSGQTWPQNTEAGLRNSAQVVVDHNVTLSYGVRADEPGIRDAVKLMAKLALAPGELPNEDAYKGMVNSAALGIVRSQSQIIQIQSDLGLKEERMQTLQIRHDQTFTLVSQQVLEIEEADPYDVATRLLDYENRLKATYEISGRMHSLSLVNYMP